MSLVHEDKFEVGWVVFRKPLILETGNTRYGDVCNSTRFGCGHINLDTLIRVCGDAVPCSLLDELPAVRQNQGLGCLLRKGLNMFNKPRKYDLQAWLAGLPEKRSWKGRAALFNCVLWDMKDNIYGG